MKLMSKQRIKECNMEIINSNKIIDVSWFQTKAVSYDCCKTLAFLFRLGKLKDINNYEDLVMDIPGFKTNFKEMGEKISLSDSIENSWEFICEKLQMFAFYKADNKYFIDLLQLIKLLGVIVYIDHPRYLNDFIETYKQPECRGIIEELLKNGQVQFTSEKAMQCFEDYFKDLNTIMFEQVLKSIPADTENVKMDVF